MVDNVAITAGSGTTIGADDVGGVLIQRVKTTWGPDGTANDADVATGKPLPVQLRSATGLIPIGEPTDAAATATDTTSVTGVSLWKQISKTLQAFITLAGAPFAKITDGTNTASVKAVSTAPVTATDPALVTVLRPDSPGIITTGTAGTASAVVLSVQGIAGATPQPVGGVTVTQAASSTITRPADTTAYASGDLVANSVTAGSVTNLQFTTLARVSGGSGVIIGAQIQKSTASATNAAFRLHLFNTAPTYTSAGDNSAISTVVVASAKGYLGYIDITTMIAFSDVGWGSGAPDNSRGGIPYVATAQIIYGLLEARGAYTPGNAEVFTVTVDALQD